MLGTCLTTDLHICDLHCWAFLETLYVIVRINICVCVYIYYLYICWGGGCVWKGIQCINYRDIFINSIAMIFSHYFFFAWFLIWLFFSITRIVNGSLWRWGCICISHKKEIENVTTNEKVETFLILKHPIIFTVTFSSVLEILWNIS